MSAGTRIQMTSAVRLHISPILQEPIINFHKLIKLVLQVKRGAAQRERSSSDFFYLFTRSHCKDKYAWDEDNLQIYLSK